MTPANFHEEARRVINGPRPSPLRIKKESHIIQKSSSNISGDAAANVMTMKQQDVKLNQHQKQPVIIYTHSPEVIHTKPRDFMALVQKLTGISRSEDQILGADESKKKNRKTSFGEKNCAKVVSHEDNGSSSVTTDEKCGANISRNINESSSAESPVNKGLNHQIAEIPLFTPNSNNLFYSPQSYFRHPDLVLPSSLSPSFLEFMKGLPEY